jgi:hypothetical protein
MPAGEDRIAKLSQRFKTHAVGRRPENTRTRERHSLYLDTELVAQANRAYRDISHQLYPKNVSKSVFWETLLSFGLDRLPELTDALAKNSEASEEAER